jgi:hypothetical protein
VGCSGSRRGGTVDGRMEGIAHPFDHAFEQRDIDPGAPAGFVALNRRGKMLDYAVVPAAP